jgi:arylsulfatase A-like enzyme
MSSADSRPNIVLVTIESTRADHVGAYGYARATTPALDALASQATLFEDASAVTSWTLPSHASIFTGLYPAAHGVVAYDHRLDDSQTTLAEVLHDSGYQTAAVVSGPFLRSIRNLDQGFELYDQSVTHPDGSRAAHDDVTNPEVERLAEQFLRSGRDPERPFFLFLYLWDVHYDYIPPPPFDTMFVPPDAEPVDVRGYEVGGEVSAGSTAAQMEYVLAEYDGEIAATDALLGRLFGVLEELGLWDETAVVVTADHGEEFFEHGHKGHRNNLYRESLHVPLIVKLPGRHRASRSTEPVSLVDLFPTILRIAGVQEIPYQHGRSLFDPAASGTRPLFFELKTEWEATDPATGEPGVVSDLWLAVRDGDRKLVLARNEGMRELYDVARDPGERTPLGPEHAAEIVELDEEIGAVLETMKRDARRFSRSAPIELTPEEEERLRSLGYLGRSGPED